MTAFIHTPEFDVKTRHEGLNDEIKEWIDNASYETLLRKSLFYGPGHPLFWGDVGEYCMKAIENKAKGDYNPEYVERHIRKVPPTFDFSPRRTDEREHPLKEICEGFNQVGGSFEPCDDGAVSVRYMSDTGRSNGVHGMDVCERHKRMGRKPNEICHPYAHNLSPDYKDSELWDYRCCQCGLWYNDVMEHMSGENVELDPVVAGGFYGGEGYATISCGGVNVEIGYTTLQRIHIMNETNDRSLQDVKDHFYDVVRAASLGGTP